MKPPSDPKLRAQLSSAGIDPHVYQTVAAAIDRGFYRAQFEGEAPPPDCALHYIMSGSQQGRDPSPDFSTFDYLRRYADVAEAKVNPYYHYLARGRVEQRQATRSRFREDSAAPSGSVFAEHGAFTVPGPHAEELDRAIVAVRPPTVKALAYYLPQFHTIPENDAWWGEGFTEWRNLPRALPRFAGHYQPRIPSALGHYDLTERAVLARQAELAKAAGVHGFTFYYYWFNGRRLLERPLELFLGSPDIELPFSIIWANENWTRTWDGFDKDVLIRQDYREEDEAALLGDLARHFADPRYIRADGRPLFFIYRPSLIPDTEATVARWRRRWSEEHGIEPLVLMAQGFDEEDPRPFGLDGAVEFPPHKVAQGLPPINARLAMFDPDYKGHVMDYDAVLSRSADEDAPPFPLIKGCVPSWDNEPRRPGRGMVLHGSTPAKFEGWARQVAAFARANPVFGERFIMVNAWNEWAESAYLEPDVHYGAAYLNALARAVTETKAPPKSGPVKLVLFGHDGNLNGAQLLLKHLIEVFTRGFGIAVHVIVSEGGPLIDAYRELAPTSVIAAGDLVRLKRLARELVGDGFTRVIANTTVCGWGVPTLRAEGMSVVALVHELATLIDEFALEEAANNIASEADAVVFPAPMVEAAFEKAAGAPRGRTIMRPQGLYRSAEEERVGPGEDVRRELGIPARAKVVLNVGYADLRKGFDIFAAVARRIHALRPEVHFLWVGGAKSEVLRWNVPETTEGSFGRVFHFTGRFVDNPLDYYAASDLFFLSSREDPFPSVVLEAFAAGLPVVTRAGTTGCEAIIGAHGKVVRDHDVAAIADAIIEELDRDGAEAETAAAARRELVARDFHFASYAFSLAQELSPELRSVSVVVPNYNYARYLPVRLSNIFRQHYPVFEVIVLDDASGDDSLAVVADAAAQDRRRVKVIANATNSGSVFRQWRRGIEAARGEYVWIAEADDVAEETFLTTLVGAMERHGARLGFCDSYVIGPGGERLGESYKGYVNDIEANAFNASFVMDSDDFLRRFLSVKNVILNVSGVLWHRETLLAIIDELGDELFAYKVAGDWRIYIEYCRRGGKVVYHADPLNGHRRHPASVTHELAKQQHFEEIVDVQARAKSYAELSAEKRAAQQTYRAWARRVLGLAAVD